MIGLVSQPSLSEPHMIAHNNRGTTLPDLKKVPVRFILPSAGYGQTFFPQTFHCAPVCHSMSVNFDPVFPFGSFANQQNSAMCRSRHYAIVGMRHWKRAREGKREIGEKDKEQIHVDQNS